MVKNIFLFVFILISIVPIESWADKKTEEYNRDAKLYNQGVRAFEAGDYNSALKIFKPLADQGDAQSQSSIGWLYDYGLGVPEDNQKAVSWYMKAAEQDDMLARYNLAVIYLNGEGAVQKDHKKAAYFFRLSAQQGHLPAQYNLGIAYYFGLGVKKNGTKSKYWINKVRNSTDPISAQAEAFWNEFKLWNY